MKSRLQVMKRLKQALVVLMALPMTAVAQNTFIGVGVQPDVPSAGQTRVDVYLWTTVSPSTLGGATVDIQFDDGAVSWFTCTGGLQATDIGATNNANTSPCINDCIAAIGADIPDAIACANGCSALIPYSNYACTEPNPGEVRLNISPTVIGDTVLVEVDDPDNPGDPNEFSQEYVITGLQVGPDQANASHIARMRFDDVVAAAASKSAANFSTYDILSETLAILFFTTENDSDRTGSTVEPCPDNCQISDSPLPVELADFSAVVDGEDIVLNWTTASEENNSGFSIEHARGDSEEFAELAFIEGHGTTTELQEYTYRADGLDIGRHKFRLRQVDFDGAFEYSSVIEATIELAGTHRLGSAYPNPFNPSTTFELVVGKDQAVEIDVINALGQRVQRLFDGPMEANEPKNFVFEARTLPSGLYFYRVLGENFLETKQMLLVK